MQLRILQTNLQRAFALFSVVALVLMLVPASVFAMPAGDLESQAETELLKSGTWGTCPWEIDEEGTLTIHPGVGADTGGVSPWDDACSIIKKVVVATDDDQKVVAPKDSSCLFGTFKCQYLTDPWRRVGFSAESFDLSGLDTSNVEDMSYMFLGCSALTTLDLAGFDTSQVTNMSHMFSICESLTSLNLSSFNTTNVTNMSFMFGPQDRDNDMGCWKLATLDLSSFNTANVTDMSYMFRGCPKLVSLDLSEFDTSQVTDMSSMFSGCSSLVSVDFSGFETSKTADMSYMFNGCSSLEDLNFANFNTSNVTDMSSMFAGCSSITRLDLSSFDTSRVTNMQCMFGSRSMNFHLGDCSALESIDLSSFDMSNVTDMSYMFDGCSALKGIDLSSFDTSNVTNMSHMFHNCSALTSLDFSSFDTSQVENTYSSGMGKYGMCYMFAGCSSLTSLDLSSFDTAKVSEMDAMFSGCTSLAALDLSSFDTSGVWYAGQKTFFEDCFSLASIKLGEQFTFFGIKSDVLFTLPEGEWESASTSQTYTAQEIAESRSKVADTYTRTPSPLITSVELDRCELPYSAAGSPKPTVTVKSQDTLLVEGVDYDITWPGDLQNVGSKTLQVVAKGDYAGRLSAIYSIAPVPLSAPSIDSASFAYEGVEKKPVVSVFDGSVKLMEGKNYTIAWPEDLVNPGKKTVTVTGIGNYTGTRIVDYVIEEPAAKPEPPKIIEGSVNVTWKPGLDIKISFRSDAPLSLFVEVRVNGKVVAPVNYILREGSTIVELKPEYLATLPEGRNTIDIVSKTGTASSSFNVEKAPEEKPAPGQPQQPEPAAPDDPTPVESQIMYRLYNPNSGEHFYTADASERDAIAGLGWTYEGEAWTAPVKSETPVYRLYSGTDHHYTTSANERDELVRVGWSYEGVGWYSDDAKGVGLHRLFNPGVDPTAPTNNSGSHHYTTSDEERDVLVSIGWVYEDFGWHGVK